MSGSRRPWALTMWLSTGWSEDSASSFMGTAEVGMACSCVDFMVEGRVQGGDGV